MSDAHRGAKIGPRVANLVSKAIIATHKALIGTKHKLAMMVFRSISDEISHEVDQTLGPVFKSMAERYDPNGDLHGLLTFMAHNHGQLKALVGQGVAQSGLLWPISQIINNALAPLVYDALRHDAVSIPDAATVAQSVAQGTTSYGEGENDIAAWGFNAGWAQSMIALAQNWPSPDLVLVMRNRGLISDSEAKTFLKRASLPDEAIDQTLATRYEPLSPADAALAVLRGNMSHEEGVAAAEQWGVVPSEFEILIGNTGEPLALMQLLEAKRRGFIDDARLVRGILQSRIRDEWVDVAEKLAYAPMSVADAVNAVVQNHLPMAEGERIAEYNGLEAGQFGILYQTAGEPLSRTEMSDLVNRGEATIAEFEQALRESRLKDKYNRQAILLRRRLLEPRMLASAVQSGSVSHAYALQVAMQYGYDKRDAEILVSHGSASKLKTYKDRVVASVESLYEDGAIPEAEAAAIIKSMGYEDTEVKFILEAARARKDAATIKSGISAIRSKYVARHITIQQASGLMDALGVPSEQRDAELKLWVLERAADTKTLTEAQVVKAVSKQLISPEDGLKRLEAMGYNTTDAGLLLQGA